MDFVLGQTLDLMVVLQDLHYIFEGANIVDKPLLLSNKQFIFVSQMPTFHKCDMSWQTLCAIVSMP